MFSLVQEIYDFEYNKEMLRQLPIDLPGKIYCSPMPFGHCDLKGDLFNEYQVHGVRAVVLLASDEECLDKAGFNLRQFYLDNGMQVIHLPVADFGAPKRTDLEEAVDNVIQLARSNVTLAIHCHYGIGRTGLFAAFIGKRLLGLSGLEVIFWIRGVIPGALEAPEQIQMVLE